MIDCGVHYYCVFFQNISRYLDLTTKQRDPHYRIHHLSGIYALFLSLMITIFRSNPSFFIDFFYFPDFFRNQIESQ